LESIVAAKTATIVAHAVANQVVKTIPAGSFEPADVRIATTLVGRMANPAGIDREDSTMALVRRSLLGVQAVELLHGADSERRPRHFPTPERSMRC
jgi:hypothetical protein